MGTTRVGTSSLGQSTNIFVSGSQGASLTAASSITITDSVHEVTGSATINTINGGRAGQGLLLYKPTGATWALGSAGNIKASTGAPATERFVLLWTADGNTWRAESGSVSVVVGSNKLSVTESSPGVYSLDVVEANLNMNNTGTTLAITKGGTGQTTALAAFNALSPTTTRGDLIVQNSSGDDARLPTGAAGTVLVGGTDPSYSANPVVTSINIADANNGLVSIGSNNLGIKINGSNELDINATRIAPATNLGQNLGDASKYFDSVYSQEFRGWRIANLAISAGAQTIATIPLPASSSVGITIEGVIVGANATDFFAQTISSIISAVAKSTTITTNNSKLGATVAASSAGTLTIGTGSLFQGADAGSNVFNIQVLVGTLTGTPSTMTLYYKISFFGLDPVVTEVL